MTIPRLVSFTIVRPDHTSPTGEVKISSTVVVHAPNKTAAIDHVLARYPRASRIKVKPFHPGVRLADRINGRSF